MASRVSMLTLLHIWPAVSTASFLVSLTSVLVSKYQAALFWVSMSWYFPSTWMDICMCSRLFSIHKLWLRSGFRPQLCSACCFMLSVIFHTGQTNIYERRYFPSPSQL